MYFSSVSIDHLFYSTIFSMLHYQPVFSLDLSISLTHTPYTHNTLSFSLERASSPSLSLSVARSTYSVLHSILMGDEIGRNISFKRSECSIHYLTLTQNRNEENEYSTVVHHVQMQSKWAEHTHIDVDIAHSYSHNL